LAFSLVERIQEEEQAESKAEGESEEKLLQTKARHTSIWRLRGELPGS
jgi:hypothetical protein